MRPHAWKVRQDAERRAAVEQQLRDGLCRVRTVTARDLEELEAARRRRDSAWRPRGAEVERSFGPWG
jgi:hypothetical protein